MIFIMPSFVCLQSISTPMAATLRTVALPTKLTPPGWRQRSRATGREEDAEPNPRPGAQREDGACETVPHQADNKQAGITSTDRPSCVCAFRFSHTSPPADMPPLPKVKGVCYYPSTGCFVGFWTSPHTHKGVQRAFSVAKHGYEGAYKKALSVRKAAEASGKVSGRPGEQAAHQADTPRQRRRHRSIL